MKSIHSHHIVTETEVVDGWLTIDDEGRIAAIGDTPVGTRIEEVQDDWLLPGLIDPHLHGFMGWNASKTTDETQILHMADALLWAGVTACVPSCISSPVMLENVRALHEARIHQRQGAEILGLYMEGPFYNPEYNGGTPMQYFQKPSVDQALRFYEAAGGDLISLGLAPELPGAMEVITVLNQKGVRVGIAHTGADYDQTMAAIDAGCKMATHSFNAMRGLHHREVGVTGAILLDPRIYNEINCDFPDGTIYGSGRLLLQDVFNLIDTLKIPVPEAVAMASLNAARFLNVDDRLGSLKVGKQADFIIVDPLHQCRATFKKGVQVCGRDQRNTLVNPKFMNLKIA